MTSQISMALLILSFGTYLLVIGVRDGGSAADLQVLAGAALSAAGAFSAGFTIKRFLFARRVRQHVRGKKRLEASWLSAKWPRQKEKNFLRG